MVKNRLKGAGKPTKATTRSKSKDTTTKGKVVENR
jgi:hypothetical protein